MPRMRALDAARALDWAGPAGGRRRWVHASTVVAFALAALLAAFAQQAERPITAAIVFLLGVTIVGALEGVAGGVLAALAASAVYNFFLAEPTFRFSLSSIEDLAPLLAFNASAVASAYLTGRLRDRARAVETANARLKALLDLSQKLQAAFDAGQVLAAINAFPAGRDGIRAELFLAAGERFEPVGGEARHLDFAMALRDSGRPAALEPERSGFLLLSTSETIGVLVASSAEGGPLHLDAADANAVANLASLALERCLLLDKLSAAELVRKSEAFKSALLSSVSHDMRTPLGAISASASSLARYGDTLPAEARTDMLNMIQEQCHRLDRYTANLLSLSRLQAGLDQEGFTPVDAVEALGSAIAQIRALESGHRFVKRLEATEAVVSADAVMLEQVFHNVLENAVRYSPAGTDITISTAVLRSRLLVSIRDVGPGIDPKNFTRVFDRFYRAADTQGQDGRGLGLAIAKGFTEAFGGRIWIGLPSDDAGGTIVSIELPLAATAGEPAR